MNGSCIIHFRLTDQVQQYDGGSPGHCLSWSNRRSEYSMSVFQAALSTSKAVCDRWGKGTAIEDTSIGRI
ncbi:hypothetical protein O181_006826 [Austropuccinia psidii MF-1]|uniref:Uncharacterized protein n=1 Tax=Austropuccinia psidii MF-1 TaxID=1389203 RepID=A0A9Q3GH34_9BASI|nr:hypothetical protein [Austropuccinia psidii MF-1]